MNFQTELRAGSESDSEEDWSSDDDVPLVQLVVEGVPEEEAG